MKIELEYVHDSKSSKVWIIELKGKTITTSYGKKNSTLNETVLKYDSEKEARNDYEKRISEKLKKGYQEMDVSKPLSSSKPTKKVKTKSKSDSTKKKSKIKGKSKSKSDKKTSKLISKPGLHIQTISPYITDLLKFTDTMTDKQEGYYKDTERYTDESHQEVMEKMTKYYNKHFVQFKKVIDKYQTKKIGPFLQSGVIVKHIPSKLAESVLKQVNLFANSTDVDYHPNSDNKVRDIVHPSLYPLLQSTAKSNKQMDFWNRPYEESEFQWLPSEFEINDDGTCKIKSYINNLPLDNVDMYANIEKLFEFVLPQLEDVWSYINSIKLESEYDWKKAKEKLTDKLLEHSLKGRTIQVITKIVTIGLNSKQDLIGAWHIEGMPHENIVATASCTIYQDPDFEGTLSFKRVYTAQEEEHLRVNIFQNPIHEVYDLVYNQHVPVGKVDLSANTLIVFPNSHVHKVDMFNTCSKNQSRTIVVFWLINPEVKIKSTNDIEQQKYSLKTAHENRLKLMKERTFHKQTFNQRDINLCEH